MNPSRIYQRFKNGHSRVIPAKAGIQEGWRRDTGQFRLFTGLRPDGRGVFAVMPAERAWMV